MRLPSQCRHARASRPCSLQRSRKSLPRPASGLQPCSVFVTVSRAGRRRCRPDPLSRMGRFWLLRQSAEAAGQTHTSSIAVLRRAVSLHSALVLCSATSTSFSHCSTQHSPRVVWAWRWLPSLPGQGLLHHLGFVSTRPKACSASRPPCFSACGRRELNPQIVLAL